VIVAHIVVGLAGLALLLWTLTSAVKSVVVPRATPTALTRAHFVVLGRLFRRIASTERSFDARDRVMSLYGPVGLVLLPAVWVTLVVVAFTGVFWGVGVHPFSEAFIISGSSLMTLGFERPEGVWRTALAFVEAGLGLGLVSLMISYLPTIYGAFSRRETLVGMLEVRAGLPPSPATLFIRYQAIGLLADIDDDLFRPWETWFMDIEESHTSQPALVHFRSPHPDRSWITAAGCVLDTAALAASTVDGTARARASLTLRTGFFSLRRIADYFGIPFDPNPAPDAPISISRAEYDQLVAELEAAGVPLRADRDQAWRDFAGWRVNYDAVLLSLCALAMAPPARWSADRMPTFVMPTIRRGRPRSPSR